MTAPITSKPSESPADSEYERVAHTLLTQRPIHVVHLTSSRFFGGPERQMLELSRELAPDIQSTFLSFSEGNLCQSFLNEVRRAGFRGDAIDKDTPHLFAAAKELRQRLQSLCAISPGSDTAGSLGGMSSKNRQQEGVGFPEHLPLHSTVLLVHGYKAGLLGLWAGRRCGIPVIAISRGWTSENWKVRMYEWLERKALRHMDKVICVSAAQAAKVRRSGVADQRIVVIHNAIRAERFSQAPGVHGRDDLENLFDRPAPKFIIGAAGRLSPEKGFDVLVDSCQRLVTEHPQLDFGVVLFGEGALRAELQRRIDRAGLLRRFILAGFCAELDRLMPHFDLFAQSSHTEGLPNVLLEAAAAGTPVVATNVGGTGEVVDHEQTGLLIPPRDPAALATAIHRLMVDDKRRASMRSHALTRESHHFTFTSQAAEYRQLLSAVLRRIKSAN